MQHCYIAHTDILHILLVMVDGSFLESANSSAMISTCMLKIFHSSDGNSVPIEFLLFTTLFLLVPSAMRWLHARKENLSGKRRDHKRLVVTTVSHLKFRSLEMLRKAFFLIMGVFSLYETNGSSLLYYYFS